MFLFKKYSNILFLFSIIQAGQIQPTSVIKTEYSTFTYFITSLDGSQTVTSTDIVVSSNVVTETLNKAQATPILQATPLASAIFVSQYSNLFSLRDHPFKTSAFFRGRGGVKNCPNLLTDKVRSF